MLNGNGLRDLPQWLGNLTKLQHLSLASNKLCHVPDVIQSITSLTTLVAADNELTCLPPWLHGNRMCSLSPSLPQTAIWAAQ
jgi:Leucine-rich repeat (LRR) protein